MILFIALYVPNIDYNSYAAEPMSDNVVLMQISESVSHIKNNLDTVQKSVSDIKKELDDVEKNLQSLIERTSVIEAQQFIRESSFIELKTDFKELQNKVTDSRISITKQDTSSSIIVSILTFVGATIAGILIGKYFNKEPKKESKRK